TLRTALCGAISKRRAHGKPGLLQRTTQANRQWRRRSSDVGFAKDGFGGLASERNPREVVERFCATGTTNSYVTAVRAMVLVVAARRPSAGSVGRHRNK